MFRILARIPKTSSALESTTGLNGRLLGWNQWLSWAKLLFRITLGGFPAWTFFAENYFSFQRKTFIPAFFKTDFFKDY